MKRLYNVKWFFLLARNKAMLAENRGRWLKQKLSASMALAGSKDWVSRLDKYVASHNAKYIKGTNYRRSDAQPSDYFRIMMQKYNTDQPGMLVNISASKNYTPEMKRKLWRFKVGDKVYLSARANYETEFKTGTFFKPSVVGAWRSRVYVVDQLFLKNAGLAWLVPTYKIRHDPETNNGSNKLLEGLFYERELRHTEARARAIFDQESEFLKAR